MKVRTYKTQSLQEGLEDIKRDLGSEALIVSTRSLPARIPFNLFRKPAWEITAAVEEKPAVQAPPVSASPGWW
jgi:flagellar biosynthesis protein FlhF